MSAYDPKRTIPFRHVEAGELEPTVNGTMPYAIIRAFHLAPRFFLVFER